MQIRHRTVDSVEVLELEGRFDAFEVPALVKWFDDHPETRWVLVNLKGVGFIDSSGLSTLVKGLKRCRQQSGDLCLVEIQQAVQIIFELTRLDKAFRIFPDEASGLAHLTEVK